MTDILLDELQAAAALSGSDLTLVKQGSYDRKGTIAQIFNYIIAQPDFSAASLLTKMLTVDGVGSNLDADLLDGQQGSFYQNASNITSGTLDANRLAVNSLSTGTHGALNLGPSCGNIKLRWGIGNYMNDGDRQRVNFSSSFSTSCFACIVTPECHRDGYGVGSPAGYMEVELDLRMYGYDTSGFDCAAIRNIGSNSDQVRPHYFAIGI